MSFVTSYLFAKNDWLVEELENAKISAFPSTIIYISPNKTPKLVDLNEIDFEDNEDMMADIDELQETKEYNTLAATSLQALPNYLKGSADNFWAFFILILECILGRSPTTDYGYDEKEVLKCIHEKQFFADFLAWFWSVGKLPS